MHRELGDERSRYGRKSLRERLGDVIAWPASNRFATGIILVVVVGGLILAVAQGRPAGLRDLNVGDCLYVPTAAAEDAGNSRPIGEPAAVLRVVLTVGAERTTCTGSHGHEVSAIVAPTLPTRGPGEMLGLLDEAAMRAMTAPLCDQAFAGYVGRPLALSRFVTFPVVPDVDGAEDWLNGGRRTVCLVARADGDWMDHPARGSGE
jgi:hypothetical protein